MKLNDTAYKVEADQLIYDGTHPVDASAVTVTLASGDDATAGTIARGQIIDCNDGVYGIHAEGGTVSVIAASETEYAADDTEVVVPAYISGTFRLSKVVTDTDLTANDIETFRSKGIYLK